MNQFLTMLSQLTSSPFRIWKAISTQTKILFSALLFAIGMYIYVVEFYGQDLSVFSIVRLSTNKYNFYSGDPVLTYFQIGDYLEKSNLSKVKITNYPTSGGYENAIKVLTDKNPSLGLVQEDILNKDDFIKQHIEFITPLYLERLHIIYNRDSFKKLTGKNPETLEISLNSNPILLQFFQNAKINIGPVGSGSKVLSSFIMTEINRQISNKILTQQLVTDKFSTAIEKLENGKLDVGFFVIGCSSDQMKRVINDPKFGMIALEIPFISHLNSSNNLNLRYTNFSDKYEDKFKNITTAGTYAYLAADKEVLKSDLSVILQRLSEIEGSGSNKELKELFYDFKFLPFFEKGNHDWYVRLLRNILIFSITFFTSATLAFLFLTWFISDKIQNKYLGKLTKVININIPNNLQFEKEVREDEEIILPFIKKDQKPIINNTIKGQQRLNLLRIEISNDTGLTDTHLNFLITRIDQIMDKLRKSLFLRLHEIKCRGELTLSNEQLRKFLTSDWITYEDYKILTSQI